MAFSRCRIFLSMLILLLTSMVSSTFYTTDLYMGSYEQTIFAMDKFTQMDLPVMVDEDFIGYLKNNNNEINARLVPIQTNTSIFDDKLDAQLIAQKNTDEKWVELMGSGSLIVNYFGNLMVIASQKDFPFTPSTPNYQYEFIRYPDSFCLTLIQLKRDLYNALFVAHTTMNRIQSSTSRFSTHLNTTLKLLTHPSPSMIKALLPPTLASMVRITDLCVDLVNDTVNKFAQVQRFIAEIIHVSTNTQTSNVNLITQLQQQINNGTHEMQLLTANVATIKDMYEQKRQALEKACQEYSEVYNTISGRSSVKDWSGGVVGAIWNTITAPITLIDCVLGVCPSKAPTVVENTASGNAMAKAKKKLEELQEAEETHNEWFEKHLANQYNLAALIQPLASLDLDKIPREKTFEILKQVFSELQNIKQQWSQIYRFFLAVSVEADITKEIIGSTFVRIIEEALTINGILSSEDREFFVELVSTATEDIDTKIALLYTMVKTYCDVSTDQLMLQLNGIDRFITLQSADSRKEALRTLENDTLATSLKVTNIVQERQLAYTVRLNNRKNQLQTYLNNMIQQQLESSIG